MEKQKIWTAVRICIPQAFTAARALLGGAALFAAHYHQAKLSATLITLGSITDAVDGALARKLKVSSEFGALFDYFADYLCYIVAPSVLSLLLIKEPARSYALIALGLPLLAGALRYPANAIRRKSQDFEKLGNPGLGTVFYAYFIVTLVFTELDTILEEVLFRWIVLVTITIVSCLMVASVRYPRLPKCRPLAVSMLIGLSIMPFVYPRILAAIALASGFIFAFAGPFLVKRRNSMT